MTERKDIKTRELLRSEDIPYDLLLLADETIAAIDKYIHDGDSYVVETENSIIGIYVLYSLSHDTIELKNIAVEDTHQSQGIGKFMLADAENRAKDMGFQEIIVGTPDIAAKQIKFYQKAGFERFAIRKDFFIVNYAQPIYEHGVQLKDMVMLRKRIGD
ncbi:MULTISPECIES: GNAT family N-acetyltransferase [Sphingobacterium]|jgi:ribosomal protein S18 acetylase RimI-like enzyme|uniref:GNAT family N-acetyltransferase n=2 Tax=Sphingobacterium TaxID=28453 RepID=A0A5D4H4Q4_9SPHI|nr:MULTISPECIES: GNAT family N-acetyltransferase [Sphingobacterium]MBD1425749.1 GNAT family N-acetyltransferase [Sphingobacterium arenae]TYR35796.1 GNAT family N-acetyltransferase [Sphingobacterium phlebotomi]HLT86064.1 GNAT family N-acetyltransferase [Sphingobacterium sp.]